jgi:hypothetical protein
LKPRKESRESARCPPNGKPSHLAQEIFGKVGKVVGLWEKFTLEEILFVPRPITIVEEEMVVESKKLNGDTSTL